MLLPTRVKPRCAHSSRVAAELKELIDRLIDERIAEGELDDSNLTFKEVQTIKEVFMRGWKACTTRISYPEPVQKQADDAESDASLQTGNVAERGVRCEPRRHRRDDG
ncbi:MAG: hypothetical protein R2838_11685 [Caldilineaceae bacterium]